MTRVLDSEFLDISSDDDMKESALLHKSLSYRYEFVDQLRFS